MVVLQLPLLTFGTFINWTAYFLHDIIKTEPPRLQ